MTHPGHARVRGVFVALLGMGVAAGCANQGSDDAAAPPESSAADRVVRLGPVDGFDLPRADLERIAVGDHAPDFTLVSYRGDTLTLSENLGEREIVLVFYRGHW
ncbi:MAG: hypothetical protein RQ745_05255 [Longimicrobiales bacterium]|nr:hypothetical protein [Longimicrobiales bacterium]